MMRARPIWKISLAVMVALGATPLAFGVGSGGTGLRILAHAALELNIGVVVNSVTFDPSQAGITINGQGGRSPYDLRPGMVADVDGNVIPGLNVGIAHSIQVSRVAKGRVIKVGSGGTGLKLDVIAVAPRTDVVLDGCATPSDIVVGTTLDVYGYSDGVSGVVDATRIECVPPLDTVELHGVASAVNPGSIVVNGALVDISNAQLIGFDGPILAGDRVGVDGTASAQGIVAATVTFDPDVVSPNGETAQVEDAISTLVSPTMFVVDSFEVDADNATFSGGTAADLAVGRVVQVKGSVVNGILKAKSVAFSTGDDSADDALSDGTPSDGEPGDGASSDGVLSASHSDDSESSGGQPDHGEPNGGESALGKPNGGESDAGPPPQQGD